jgi:hypothetical protein
MEVCLLSHEVMLQPLSPSLQSGLRFFHPPLPALPWAFLTVSFPLSEEKYGFTVFRSRNADGLGSLSPPVALNAHDEG